MAIVPTVEVFRDGKRCVCNVSDLERFAADGWAPKAAEVVEKVAAPALVADPLVTGKPSTSRRGRAKSG